MQTPPAGDRAVRYSFSVFTFDVESGELTRNHHTLRIRQQTSRLLTILLERAGSVVTREQLRELLWPDGEYLEYDQAINRAINQLRMVLRDDPRSPQFIETLPKRGYRFRPEVRVEPRETVPVLLPPQPVPARSAALEIVEPAPKIEIRRNGFAARGARRSRWAFVAAGLVLVAILGAGAAYWFQRTHMAESKVVRMGIAPFEAQGPGAAALAESFRLDLMDTMSQLPNVEMHAARSLDRPGLDEVELQRLAKLLQLDVLLLGHFTVENGQCMLQLELVRARDMAHLKSYQYSSPAVGLANIRSRIQRDVFADLQVAGKAPQTVRGSTEDAEAYHEYLQARDLVNRHTLDSLNQSVTLFSAAIGRDPAFAQAYSGLAVAHLSLSDYPSHLDQLPLARQYAEQALQRDPNLAEAHAVLGGVAFRLDWNPARAEAELRRAVALEPHYTVYHAWLSEVLVSSGRFDEGLQEVDLARTEDPLWPQVYLVDVLASGVSHQYGRMVAAARKYRDLFPEATDARDLLGWSYFASGNYKDAISEWRAMGQAEKDDARVALEDRGLAAFERGGIKAYAAVRVKAIEGHDKGTLHHPNDFVPAEWYTFVGDHDKAIAALKQIIAQRENDAMEIAVNPMYDSLHRDPEFLALVARIGLTVPTAYPQEDKSGSHF